MFPKKGVLFCVKVLALFSVALLLPLESPRGTFDAFPQGEPPRSGFDGEIIDNASRLFNEGRQIFRSDTFGSEDFWGGTLRLHLAIAGTQGGGIAEGLSPRSALAAGLKVDTEVLPASLVQALRAGMVNLEDPAVTLNLLRLNAAAKRHGHHPFALLFIDLNRFKVINDSLGHVAGDKLLVEMAQRLVECTREEDTVARLGGDEFAILLEQIRGPEDAVRVAERVLERFADPLILDEIEVSVSASIGIALSLTGEGQPENLLRDADMAMYQAKTRRSGYQIFDARMHSRALERMKLEIDMKRAIENKQIHLHYQPIVSLETGKLAGLEALARWQHNGYGAISPAKFIPLAEETGLVSRLSHWVFEQACSQMRHWLNSYPLGDDCFISVNISSKQLSDGNLIDEVDQVLRDTGLEPQHLRLEITESAIVENTRAAAHLLGQLKTRQIKLCLDDFGKGFSSLNYLHRFPIEVLKIDRSFVRRLRADLGNDTGKKRPFEIVRTIVAMAQILGMQVVAEGVEMPDQLNILRELGCEFGQGYLFSRALDAGATGRFLDASAISL